MLAHGKKRLTRLLRWSERYTRTDMVYLAQGGIWLTVGQVAAVFMSFALAVGFGHLASQDAYGNYKYVLTAAALIGAFSLTGLGTAIIQAVARGKEGVLRQAWKLNLQWSWGIVVISLAAAAYYGFAEQNFFLAASLCIVAVLLPLLNGFTLYDPYLIGKKDFRRNTLYGIFDSFFPTLLLLGALLLSDRAIVYVAAYFIGMTALAGICYWLTIRHARNKEQEPQLLHYSSHLSVMGFIATIADKIDSLMIFNLLGPAQLGVYAYAIAIPEQIKGMLKNLVPLSMPKFAERTLGEIKQTIWKRIFVLAGVLSIGTGSYIFAAPYLFKVFFPVYIDSIPYSQIYAISLLFIACTAPLMAVLQAHQKTKALYIATNGSAVLLLLLLPPLTIMYGIWGAIISQFIYRGVRMSLAAWQFARLRD